MNRCDECKHKDSCVCVPYGCECFELDLEQHDKQIRADERANTIDEVVDWLLSKFTYVDGFNVERVYCNADTLRINLKMQLKGETE